MTDRNRDFLQVRVGTVVGFERMNINQTTQKPYIINSFEDFCPVYIDDSGDYRILAYNRWRRDFGYIISQPDDAQEQPSATTVCESSQLEQTDRPDIVQWQRDQREYFKANIREIVTEYAEWRDKQEQPSAGRTDADMLDWLIQRTFYGVPGFDPIVHGRTPEQRIADCRAAISAAMDGEAGE